MVLGKIGQVARDSAKAAAAGEVCVTVAPSPPPPSLSLAGDNADEDVPTWETPKVASCRETTADATVFPLTSGKPG